MMRATMRLLAAAGRVARPPRAPMSRVAAVGLKTASTGMKKQPSDGLNRAPMSREAAVGAKTASTGMKKQPSDGLKKANPAKRPPPRNSPTPPTPPTAPPVPQLPASSSYTVASPPALLFFSTPAPLVPYLLSSLRSQLPPALHKYLNPVLPTSPFFLRNSFASTGVSLTSPPPPLLSARRLYSLNLNSTLCTRIWLNLLVSRDVSADPLTGGSGGGRKPVVIVDDFTKLEAFVRRYRDVWDERYGLQDLDREGMLRIKVKCVKSKLGHTGAVEERVRKALDLSPRSESEEEEDNVEDDYDTSGVDIEGAEDDEYADAFDFDDEEDLSRNKAKPRKRVEDAKKPSPKPQMGSVTASSSSSPSPSSNVPPPQLLLVTIVRDRLTVSLDTSGHDLSKRGYRPSSGKAPLNEVVARGVLLGLGWGGGEAGGPSATGTTSVPADNLDGGKTADTKSSATTNPTLLIDPFCGSGTIPIEAALLLSSRGVVPSRRLDVLAGYPFLRWPSFNAGAWSSVLAALSSPATPGAPAGPAAPVILGVDRDAGAIATARENAKLAGVEHLTRFEVSSAGGMPDVARRFIDDYKVASGKKADSTTPIGLICCNPPWGGRIGNEGGRDLRNLYGKLGASLSTEDTASLASTKKLFENWKVAVITSSPALAKQVKITKNKALEETMSFAIGGRKVGVWVGDIKSGSAFNKNTPHTTIEVTSPVSSE